MSEEKNQGKWNIFSAPGYGKGAPVGLDSVDIYHSVYYAMEHYLSSAPEKSFNNGMEFAETVHSYFQNVGLIYLDEEVVEQYRTEGEREWMKVSTAKGIRDCFTWQANQSQEASQIEREIRKTANYR